MKGINKSLFPVLETAVKESLKNYESNRDGHSLSDLYVYFDEDDCKLTLYDDLENRLHELQFQKEDGFNIDTLRCVCQQLEQEQTFEKEFINKPFTVSMIDDDFIVTKELVFVDDNTLKLESDLWKNVNRELDAFLKHLMEN